MTCHICEWPTDNPAHVYGCKPVGVKPRVFWVEDRLRELEGAIARYAEANFPIPEEWRWERKVHIKYLNGVYNGE